jgi:hypothetical protein
MSKIAFVSGWYSYGNNYGIAEHHKYILDCLYNSAKKYFLKEHNVDFIFITNDETIKIDNVQNILIDHQVDGFWYMCLMKILSLKYLDNKYDYIFVSDTDQIFVNYVDNELLQDNFYMLNHFYCPTIESVHKDIIPPVDEKYKVPLNFENKKDFWTMGNFFGGKSQIMLDLCSFSEHQHNIYRDVYHPDFHFYTRYPEELFLIKYIYENNIPHKRLNSTVFPQSTGGDYFLSDFQEDIEIYPNISEVRLIHNTKKNVDLLKKIIKYYSD